MLNRLHVAVSIEDSMENVLTVCVPTGQEADQRGVHWVSQCRQELHHQYAQEGEGTVFTGP